MTAIYLPKPAQAERQRAHAREVLDRLDDVTITELLRRARFSAGRDGHRPSSELQSNGGATGDPDRRDPTGRMATAGSPDDASDEWAELPDPVREAISELFAGLAEALGVLRQVDRRRQYVLSAADALRGRQSTVGVCAACGRTVARTKDDRLRGGYCEACYKAWNRASRPDRAAFQHRRRKVWEVEAPPTASQPSVPTSPPI